jgi:hypothetical protein
MNKQSMLLAGALLVGACNENRGTSTFNGGADIYDAGQFEDTSVTADISSDLGSDIFDALDGKGDLVDTTESGRDVSVDVAADVQELSDVSMQDVASDVAVDAADLVDAIDTDTTDIAEEVDVTTPDACAEYYNEALLCFLEVTSKEELATCVDIVEVPTENCCEEYTDRIISAETDQDLEALGYIQNIHELYSGEVCCDGDTELCDRYLSSYCQSWYVSPECAE